MRALNQCFSQVEADEGGNQIYLYENVTDYYFIAALHTVFFSFHLVSLTLNIGTNLHIPRSKAELGKYVLVP